MKLHKMLEILEDNKVPHCFQAQHREKYSFYNLSVNDRYGTAHYFNSNSKKEIKEGLEIIRSDLFTRIPSKQKIPTPSFPMPPMG